MNSREYTNFDLSIERAGEHYRARVLQSCAGEGSASFDLPFSATELENFILKIGHARRGGWRAGRGSDSAEMATAKEFGARLFASVFQGDVYACLRASLEEARTRQAGVRVLLRLAPELANLPWEYLYNPAWNQFFALSADTPLVRYLELSPSLAPLALNYPLRVLVMISSPDDYEPLEVECEWADLQTALGPLIARGRVVLERLEGASLLALQHQLRRAPYHVFHFIGHGSFDEQKQDGVLILCDERGRGRPASGQDLGTLLRNYPSLRLALLNACEGARTGRDDPFAGAAQSLVQMGLPAVIAMQFEISDSAAVLFAQEFYAALADGYAVDAALIDARTAIFAAGASVEWGTPVLFTRSADGQIFDLGAERRLPAVEEPAPQPAAGVPALETPPSAAPAAARGELHPPEPILPTAPGPSRLYADGLAAFHLGDWPRAVDCFQSVLKIHPGYRDAAHLLEKAQAEIARPPSTRRQGKLWAWLSAHRLAVGLGLAGLCGLIFILSRLGPLAAAPDPTATPTASLTAAPPTGTPVPPSPTFTPSPTWTPLPSPTWTLTPSLTATITPTRTLTLPPPPGMVLIPAGAFQMGSEEGSSEKPVHPVTLSAFWIDLYEVTNAKYAQCVAAQKCSPPDLTNSYTRTNYYIDPQYANYPVVNVTWEQAKTYCEWRKARLPSEAEWEKAARGGLEGKLYPWGDDAPICTPGAINGALFGSCSTRDTLAVGTFKPNGYGLYDMTGNAWEWVNDWYSLYGATAVNNPTGPAAGQDRVVRGGAWNSDPHYLRVAYRANNPPAKRNNSLSFRCAASP